MKRLFNLNENLGHQNLTIQTRAIDATGMDNHDFYSRLNNELELLNIDDNTVTILRRLKNYSQLVRLGLPSDIRPHVFAKLVAFGSVLMARFLDSRSLFQAYFDLMTLVKAQIDAQPQNDVAFEEKEWQDLQKLIYILSDWEAFTEKNLHVRAGHTTTPAYPI